MKDKSSRRLLTTSVLLMLIALVSVTAATAAWMTIADHTRLNTMRLDVTTGANLRFDLDPHKEFDDYVKELRFSDIAARIARDQGFRPQDNPLTPVTTGNCVTFTLEDGSPAKKEYYLDFTLHFMASTNMVVHLTSAEDGGTRVSSPNGALPPAMRISFTADGKTSVYRPGMGGTSRPGYGGKIFGLAGSDDIVYDDSNTLFTLKKEVNKAVRVRIWLEGTDPNCTDELRGAEYTIRLRFVGTDKDGNILEDPHSAAHLKGK